MNRLLYGDEDPKTLVLDFIEITEECKECYGVGMIYYDGDTGEQITKEQFRNDPQNRDAIIEKCPYCEGEGYLRVYMEDPKYTKYRFGR